jgi:nucleoside-diphosphate-sugar epimerase
MSHVVPDLIQKCAKGQDPLHILGDGSQVRHYTYGADLAKGIVTALFHVNAVNEDFNLSSPVPTTVLELAGKIWDRFHPGEPLRFVSDVPYAHDVQLRAPSTDKAEKILGWKATTTLDEMLDIVVPWVTEAAQKGEI